MIDADPQGSLTASLGYDQPDKLEISLSTAIGKIVNDEPIPTGYGILHQAEGVDLLPGNIELSGVEVTLVDVMSRESILRQYINEIRLAYEYIF